MSHSRLDTDVVIAGAGMIGLATACALGQQGLRVQLVDPRFTTDSLQQNDAITLRVCALSPASLQLLRNVGAWSPAQERRACSYSHMHVVDAHSHGELHFNSDEIGQSRLGAIVENAWVESALLSALQRQGVHSPKPNAITHFASEDDHISVKLDSKERIRARLLIAADGARSKIRESISDQMSVHDYAQSGLVTTISAQSPHLNTARQRFLGDAILGLLPLFNGQYSIVWSLPEKQARKYQEMPKSEFLKVLNEASGAMIGDITDCGERGVFPLRMQIAQKFAAQRCAIDRRCRTRGSSSGGIGCQSGICRCRCTRRIAG